MSKKHLVQFIFFIFFLNYITSFDYEINPDKENNSSISSKKPKFTNKFIKQFPSSTGSKNKKCSITSCKKYFKLDKSLCKCKKKKGENL